MQKAQQEKGIDTNAQKLATELNVSVSDAKEFLKYEASRRKRKETLNSIGNSLKSGVRNMQTNMRNARLRDEIKTQSIRNYKPVSIFGDDMLGNGKRKKPRSIFD